MSAYPWPAPRGPVAEPGSLAMPGDDCAGCGLLVAAGDVAFTDGGQRLHANGCPMDERARLRIEVAERRAHLRLVRS